MLHLYFTFAAPAACFESRANASQNLCELKLFCATFHFPASAAPASAMISLPSRPRSGRTALDFARGRVKGNCRVAAAVYLRGRPREAVQRRAAESWPVRGPLLEVVGKRSDLLPIRTIRKCNASAMGGRGGGWGGEDGRGDRTPCSHPDRAGRWRRGQLELPSKARLSE